MTRALLPFAVVAALHLIGQDAAAAILAGWLFVFWTSYLLAHASRNDNNTF